MDVYAFVSGFVVQAAFLPVEGIGQSPCDGKDGHQSAEVHAGERPGKAAADKAKGQGSDAPPDEPALEPPIYEGLLKPLVYGEPADHQTPKNALMTTDTSTRKRQEPPQPISSLLMSWSPEFHLM